MKIGKEIKITDYTNYNTFFGSINSKHPKAIYLTISSWAEPKSESDNGYRRPIGDLIKSVRQKTYTHFNNNDINTIFSNERTIIDLDIKESGVRFGKRSFMNCDLTLFLIDEIPMTSECVRDKIDELLSMLINDVFEKNKTFDFHLRKKVKEIFV